MFVYNDSNHGKKESGLGVCEGGGTRRGVWCSLLWCVCASVGGHVCVGWAFCEYAYGSKCMCM